MRMIHEPSTNAYFIEIIIAKHLCATFGNESKFISDKVASIPQLASFATHLILAILGAPFTDVYDKQIVM